MWPNFQSVGNVTESQTVLLERVESPEPKGSHPRVEVVPILLLAVSSTMGH